MKDDFYQKLPAVDTLKAFASLQDYTKLPDDWVVLSADIVNSTGAIARGEYRNVNMVGASVIAAVSNACSGIEIPFIFGGDGASLAVPASCEAPAYRSMQALQAKSPEFFKLQLRIGKIKIADLNAQGHDVRVMKYAPSPKNHISFFAGGGLEAAERALKDDKITPKDDSYQFDEADLTLTGLSCRWQPLKPARGKIISLIIKPDGNHALKRMIKTLESCLDRKDFKYAAPISIQNQNMKFLPSTLPVESELKQYRFRNIPFKRALSFALIYMQAAMEWGMVQLPFSLFGYNLERYKQEVTLNNDFVKFNDMIYCVLDVSNAEIAKITQFLEQGHRDHHFAYGIHIANEALMTCLVHDMVMGEHIHFVDGNDGGFAAASVGLKQQLKNMAL
ncbi:MAG: DUF3095 family protein [Alphaproteobacteria bacterium]